MTDLIQQYGFPTAVCIVGGFGVIRVCSWTAKEILLPLRDRLFRHFEMMSGVLEKVPDSIAAIEEQASSATGILQQLHDGHEQLKEMHSDPNSAFSTSRTNASLGHLIDAAAKATEASRQSLGEQHAQSVLSHLSEAKHALTK